MSDLRQSLTELGEMIERLTQERDAAIRERYEAVGALRYEVALHKGIAAERDTALARVAEMEEQAETLRLQLTACGVLAGCDTKESLEHNSRTHPDFMCDSVRRCIQAAQRQIDLRSRVAELERQVNSSATLTGSPAPAVPTRELVRRLASEINDWAKACPTISHTPNLDSIIAECGKEPTDGR